MMVEPRSHLLLLAALASGCSTAKPTSRPPVASPFIELEHPSRVVRAAAEEPAVDEAAKAGADDVARASTMLRDLQRGDGSALQNPWGDAGNDENPSKVWNDVPLPEPNRASAESRPGVGDPREGLGAADIGIGAGGGDRTSATVVADEPTVDGGLNEAVVRRILWHNAGLARSCYQKALEDRPGLSGRVVLELAIGPAGAVTTVTIRQGMDPEVDACVRRAMKRMQFPARDGGGVVRVGYPLVFRTAR